MLTWERCTLREQTKGALGEAVGEHGSWLWGLWEGALRAVGGCSGGCGRVLWGLWRRWEGAVGAHGSGAFRQTPPARRRPPRRGGVCAVVQQEDLNRITAVTIAMSFYAIKGYKDYISKRQCTEVGWSSGLVGQRYVDGRRPLQRHQQSSSRKEGLRQTPQ